MNEESAGEWLFRQKLPAHRRGIDRKNAIPRGITSLYIKNPPEEVDSDGHYSLTLILTGKIKCAENPPNGNNSRISNFKS
jgi:hypothetical protein